MVIPIDGRPATASDRWAGSRRRQQASGRAAELAPGSAPTRTGQ